MALVGLPEFKRGDERQTLVAPKTSSSIEKISTNSAKTAMWLDKTKENTVVKSGLLTSKDFTVRDVDNIPIDIFERRPNPSSGDTIFHDIFDLGKDAVTGSAYDRIQVNKNALEVFETNNPGQGVQAIGDLLTEKGFKPSQIKDILGENADKWISSTEQAAINAQQAGTVGHSAAPNIPLLNQSPVFDVDKFPEDFGPGYESQLSSKLQNSQGPITNAPKSNDALNSLNELIKSKYTETKESLKGAGYFPDTASLEGHSPGNVDMPDLSKFSDTTAGLSSSAGDVMTRIMESEAVTKAGGYIDDVLSYGGKAEGLLGKIGQVGGIVKAGTGLAKLTQEGERYQGTEDIIQGAIAYASPALIAAGPVGWAVLGLSAIEDLFLEDIIDFDWG